MWFIEANLNSHQLLWKRIKPSLSPSYSASHLFYLATYFVTISPLLTLFAHLEQMIRGDDVLQSRQFIPEEKLRISHDWIRDSGSVKRWRFSSFAVVRLVIRVLDRRCRSITLKTRTIKVKVWCANQTRNYFGISQLQNSITSLIQIWKALGSTTEGGERVVENLLLRWLGGLNVAPAIRFAHILVLTLN